MLVYHLSRDSIRLKHRRDNRIYISVVRLYHLAPWTWLYSYRAVLVTLRMLELSFIAGRYLFFRALLLVGWTRLPGLRDTRPPYAKLGDVLAPVKTRASLQVGGGQLGSELGLVESAPELSGLMSAFLADVKPPPRSWSVFGCVLRGLLTDLGPCFIKFGQIMSMREEIPPTVRNELQLLQDKLPPMSYKEVKIIIERELQEPLEQVFEYVDETPIAAASLSQVQRAKLRHHRYTEQPLYQLLS